VLVATDVFFLNVE